MKGFSYHVADIGIAYREDIDAAKAAILAAYDDMTADLTWQTKLVGGIEWFGVEQLSSSSVVLRARIKTRPGEQWAVGRAYTELVKKHLDAAGIEIPFPQQTVWFGAMRDGSSQPARIMLERRPPPTPKPTAPPREVATKQTLAEGSPTDADGGDEE
jgi:small conductance mechanosensitive channel